MSLPAGADNESWAPWHDGLNDDEPTTICDSCSQRVEKWQTMDCGEEICDHCITYGKKVSECCTAKLEEESDICTDCKEHSGHTYIK